MTSTPCSPSFMEGAERAVINGASQAVEWESQINLIYLTYKNKVKRSRRCVITRLRWHRHSNILLAYYCAASSTRASLSRVPLRETYSSVLRNNCCLRTRGENRILWFMGRSEGGLLNAGSCLVRFSFPSALSWDPGIVILGSFIQARVLWLNQWNLQNTGEDTNSMSPLSHKLRGTFQGTLAWSPSTLFGS